VSVIVPVRNEAAFLGATLADLLDQTYPTDRFEVLVADGGSTDGTRELVRDLQLRHANLRLLDNPRRWSSAGRNVGVRAARGDILVVVDGHCQLDSRSYLRDLVDAFERSGADCVGRPQPLDVTDATGLQRAVAAARASRLGHHPDSFIYAAKEQFVKPQSVAIAYRRAVFDRIGLFDEAFDACEDVEFNHRVDRAGFRCFFTDRVRVHYHPRGTLAGLFRQMMRYGRGRVRLLRKHPETFTLPGFLPAAFVAGLVVGPVLSLLSGWLALVYGGAVAVYMLAVSITSLGIRMRDRDGQAFPWLPAVFAAVHGGAGVGQLLELCFGKAQPPQDR
jgi:succinoglycan biosynthesis protein ExoA